MKAIVVTFDRLPLRLLGCYGNRWIQTENFDRLAADSALFERHFGENFDRKAKSHAWWTGCYHFPRRDEQLIDRPTLDTIFRKSAVTTCMLVEGDNEQNGIAVPNFEHLVAVPGKDGFDVLPNETPFAELVTKAEEVIESLSSNRDDSWLLWLKSRGVPSTFIPPREFAEIYGDVLEETDVEDSEESRIEDEGQPHFVDIEDVLAQLESKLELLGRNDAENRTEIEPGELKPLELLLAGYVQLLDWSLGRLLAAIAQSKISDDVMLVVTAAESFGIPRQRGLSGQFAWLGEDVIHTPLFIRLPAVDSAARIHALTQSVDLPVTLLDWFQIGELPETSMEGWSLLPIIRGDEVGCRDYLCVGDDGRACGIRTDDLYLVCAGDATETVLPTEPKLFVKPDDFCEVNEVAAQLPEDVAELEKTLKKFVASARDTVPDDFPNSDAEGDFSEDSEKFLDSP